MSFEKENPYNANDFIVLKNRVKAEMKRRNGYGSLTSYGESQYDYSEQPSKDKTLDVEHYSKIRDLQSKINPSGIPSKQADGIIQEMTVLDAKQTVFEAQPRGARSGNDCNSACTGMCVSACTTTCTGSCSGGCSSCTGCSGCSSCSGGCSGCSGCGSSCSNNCSGGCTSCSGCSGGCSSSCSGCSGGCTANCGGNCRNGCSGNCTRVGGSCSGSCSGGCTGVCRSSN
ncbi:hypothetical protein [Vallitalea maricola]|uniref:Uncharacterized protein n=1 Tax=Vallitalea maricola TaxID=3074433 RepID=A0ACB5UNZ3_9FIRM|nr:hypothetical protein AN2V17_35670 [Vallitalea sp. AN17-2]